VPPLALPLLAVVAGVVSFSSPCCLPLLPGYASYITALPVSSLGTKEARSLTLRTSFAFVAGFTLVFTALGVVSTFFGFAVLRALPTVVRVAGVGIIVLGLSMMGVIRIPILLRERRVDMARLPKGSRGAFAVGLAFAAGWTPCIGPVLATILAAAASPGPSRGVRFYSFSTRWAWDFPLWSWPLASGGPRAPWNGSAATAVASRSSVAHSWSESVSCSSQERGIPCSTRFSGTLPVSAGPRSDGSERNARRLRD
jgi:cytochrome c-type biogenesis protein